MYTQLTLITSHLSNLQNSAETWKFRGKGQTLWLSFKFCGPLKTVGLIYNTILELPSDIH